MKENKFVNSRTQVKFQNSILYIAAIAFGKNAEIRISVTIYHISIMIDLLLIFLFGICFMSIDD